MRQARKGGRRNAIHTSAGSQDRPDEEENESAGNGHEENLPHAATATSERAGAVRVCCGARPLRRRMQKNGGREGGGRRRTKRGGEVKEYGNAVLADGGERAPETTTTKIEEREGGMEGDGDDDGWMRHNMANKHGVDGKAKEERRGVCGGREVASEARDERTTQREGATHAPAQREGQKQRQRQMQGGRGRGGGGKRYTQSTGHICPQ